MKRLFQFYIRLPVAFRDEARFRNKLAIALRYWKRYQNMRDPPENVRRDMLRQYNHMLRRAAKFGGFLTVRGLKIWMRGQDLNRFMY